jgi:hypothetical protein
MSASKGKLARNTGVDLSRVAQDFFLHRTKYTSYKMLCQVFILSHQLFIRNKNLFSKTLLQKRWLIASKSSASSSMQPVLFALMLHSYVPIFQ